VQQLLAFSRKQVVKLQVLNLNEVVAEINEMLRRVIGEHIHLQTNLAPDLWPLEADPGQLEQVIVNLAVNARDAMPNGGRLTIETANIRLSEDDVAQHPETPPGDYVLLAVSDTGCGIAAELQEHIFEPFFTTKARGQGTGLGLATVYGIVKQSRGDIRLESPAIVSPQEGDERAGPGTTFKIYLPRAVKVDTRPLPAQSRVEAPPGHETVLLVEDDPAVRDLTRQVLEQHGYHLLEAQEAGEACRLAAQHPGPIHLLLTDVIMPDVNGKDLADRLVQARPNLKILFMSGYTDEMIDRHGVLNPGIAFIAKPFSPSVLAQTVRTVLDNHTFSEVV
jgi:two-component system cell cycle sensor histidine kinase/response regulator CckA